MEMNSRHYNVQGFLSLFAARPAAGLPSRVIPAKAGTHEHLASSDSADSSPLRHLCAFAPSREQAEFVERKGAKARS